MVERPAEVTKLGVDATRHRGYLEKIRLPGIYEINREDYMSQGLFKPVVKLQHPEIALPLDVNI